MQSMTGYGKGTINTEGLELVIELKSVNHRNLDIAFRMPKTLIFLEEPLRKYLKNTTLYRGHVEVWVSYQNIKENSNQLVIDTGLLLSLNNVIEQNINLFSHFKKSTMLEALTAMNALSVVQKTEDEEFLNNQAISCLEMAVLALQQMRILEGERLKSYLELQLDQLLILHKNISEFAVNVPLEYKTRLENRLKEWNVQNVDAQRIAQEVAIMADRCCIDEELTRLHSHCKQFKQNLLSDDKEVGKKLEFLLQEMNREVNTIGSKASNVDITDNVVQCKCIIEKIREQVLNVV